MAKIILTLVRTIGLLLPVIAQAQGTLYLSNLGESSSGSVAIGSDAWAAAAFETGAYYGPGGLGYTLNSIQLSMGESSLSPIGFSISLYDGLNRNGGPGNVLGSLSGLDPASGGVLNYTPSSTITLLPLTSYWIVCTSATPVADGSFFWNQSSILNYSTEVWPGAYGSAISIDGTDWTGESNVLFQFAVYATEVPEPTTVTLAVLGLVALSFGRRKS